jgi:hypothetical protein
MAALAAIIKKRTVRFIEWSTPGWFLTEVYQAFRASVNPAATTAGPRLSRPFSPSKPGSKPAPRECADYTFSLTMRRTIALALTVIFSLMLIAPIFGPDGDANLPQCCRRNGRHRCMMRDMGRLSSNRNGFTAVSDRCPCLPASTCAVQSPVCSFAAAQQIHAEPARRPACGPVDRGRSRQCFLRNHPKRGPPTLLA